jgi:hypothetical protein
MCLGEREKQVFTKFNILGWMILTGNSMWIPNFIIIESQYFRKKLEQLELKIVEKSLA